jgi:adenylate cyclase
MLENKPGTSSARLAKLIELRLAPGADKAAVDQQIWNTFGEEWAVMFTDLTGFSRRVAEFGIIHFLQTIYESERLLIPIIDRHNGLMIKSEGDSLLVLFRRPENAVQCAIDMQRSCHLYNLDRLDEEKVLLCVGLGHGQVLKIGDSDVFGSEINAASKLGEELAKSYDVFVTGGLYRSCREKFQFEQLKIDAPAGTDAAYRLIYNKN